MPPRPWPRTRRSTRDRRTRLRLEATANPHGEKGPPRACAETGGGGSLAGACTARWGKGMWGTSPALGCAARERRLAWTRCAVRGRVCAGVTVAREDAGVFLARFGRYASTRPDALVRVWGSCLSASMAAVPTTAHSASIAARVLSSEGWRASRTRRLRAMWLQCLRG